MSYQTNRRLSEYLTEEAANLDGGSNPAGASSHRRWEEVLDRDLPGAVLATLHETGMQGRSAVGGEAHESWDYGALRNAVVSSLEHQRQPQGVMPLQNVKPPPKEKASSQGMVSSPSAEQEFLALHSASRDEERVVEERRRFRELLKAAKLSPQQIAIFERRYLDRLTNEQIAEDLGISKDQISPQRSRAFKKLQDYYERSGIDWSLVQAFEEAG
jgi:RNA polymerase sigma factor (sigma-70 family)